MHVPAHHGPGKPLRAAQVVCCSTVFPAVRGWFLLRWQVSAHVDLDGDPAASPPAPPHVALCDSGVKEGIPHGARQCVALSRQP